MGSHRPLLDANATHERLKTWDDLSLDKTLGGDVTFSHRWVLYHILEHLGQIGSLLHCMRDHEVPGLPEGRPVL